MDWFHTISLGFFILVLVGHINNKHPHLLKSAGSPPVAPLSHGICNFITIPHLVPFAADALAKAFLVRRAASAGLTGGRKVVERLQELAWSARHQAKKGGKSSPGVGIFSWLFKMFVLEVGWLPQTLVFSARRRPVPARLRQSRSHPQTPSIEQLVATTRNGQPKFVAQPARLGTREALGGEHA